MWRLRFARIAEENSKRRVQNAGKSAGLIFPPARIAAVKKIIDQKYLAIFIFRSHNTVEIIDVNNHYQ